MYSKIPAYRGCYYPEPFRWHPNCHHPSLTDLLTPRPLFGAHCLPTLADLRCGKCLRTKRLEASLPPPPHTCIQYLRAMDFGFGFSGLDCDIANSKHRPFLCTYFCELINRENKNKNFISATGRSVDGH